MIVCGMKMTITKVDTVMDINVHCRDLGKISIATSWGPDV